MNMKQFMIAFMMMLAISTTMMGQASPKKAALTKEKAGTTLTVESSPSDSAAVDSLSDSENISAEDNGELKSLKTELHGLPFEDSAGLLIPLAAIIFGCAVPVLIIFFIFWYRHKDKQAQFRLAEKALENGKDIPEGLFKEAQEPANIYARGVKNAFLGLGLGIFLWALTGEFGLGCIGFMVMFMGIGQIVIHYTQKPSDKNKLEDKSDEE
ncbi:DUF6249 domain-containing protein [uncultured Bacteroides sp.]|uniref:DUF6249 domain-containing protein n=1 Tax=uncultured Bacteroides sp. TaxID=162156 RepID=UPI002AABB054|nr:DUF6249 domain-containing protein [uncultured Bacteroides sp.]